jgi:hypothetical protein
MPFHPTGKNFRARGFPIARTFSVVAHRRLYCPNCRNERLFRRPQPNHSLHFWLTLGTLGLWGVVWLILACRHQRRRWRCGYCLSPAALEESGPVKAPGENFVARPAFRAV